MGPPSAEEAIFEAVALGARKGMLLTDRALAGSDVISTAYSLQQAIKVYERKLGKRFDLILCGKQTTDGDTAQVGAEISELLDLPHASNVIDIKLEKENVVVEVKYENKTTVQSMPLPSLLCLDSDVNVPRLPSFKRQLKLGNLKKRVETITLQELEDNDSTHYGLDGSATQVERIFPPKSDKSTTKIDGSPKQITTQLIDILLDKKFIERE
jgi:electron transfer flavoprotein beta subunit